MSNTEQGSSRTLTEIVESIRDEFTAMSLVRDETLNRSRALIRSCAAAIRAIHRHEWENAEQLLAEARAAAQELVAPLADYPMLYHTGYTQDALKELVEAHLVMATVRGEPMPKPAALQVTGATYLRGMSEAATEMRRFVLDLMRRGRVAEAEPLLDSMDEIYSLLTTVDFPDSITDGLRRNTDVLRNVLERTRGDLTMSLRQDQMRQALQRFEARLGDELEATVGAAWTAGQELGPLNDEVEGEL